MLGELEVALQRQRRVGTRAVEGAMKYPNLSLAIGVSLRSRYLGP
jgi:hypothetical protein